MRKWTTISLFLLLGCAESVEHGYMPQDDKFVQKYFEYYLSKEEVQFTKRDDGFYYASKNDIEKIMTPLGEKAVDKGLHTSSIEVTEGCGLILLQGYLDALEVVYLIYQEGNKVLLKTNFTDSRDYKVMGHYIRFSSEC